MNLYLHDTSLIFITGGVRSGKSSFAERLAEGIALETGGQLNYLATGVPADPEMLARIEKHQQDRKLGVYQWKTVEQPVHIGEVAAEVCEQDIILLDCVTTLLNNELFSEHQDWDEAFLTSVKETIVTGIMEIKNRARALIVVSNEVSMEPLSGNDLVFSYAKMLGQIHRQLVAEANRAYLIEAGVPILMKGVK